MIKQVESVNVDALIPLSDNAIKTSCFIDDKAFVYELLKCWAVYFNAKTQSKWIWEENGVVDAICMCIIGDSTSDVHYDISHIKPQTKQEQQYMTFRKRITAGYSKISFHAEAELEIMSSLHPFQGIGKQLLMKLEAELKDKGIKQYIVCTNEMCSYQWYERQGFVLHQDTYIDISDLDCIFGKQEQFRLFCFKKDLI